MAIMPPRQLHTIVPGSCSPGPLDSKVGTMGPYLEGQGDSVARSIMGIVGATIWITGYINLLTKSP